MYNTQILITSSIQTDFDHQSNIYNYKVQNISSTSNLIKKKKTSSSNSACVVQLNKE